MSFAAIATRLGAALALLGGAGQAQSAAPSAALERYVWQVTVTDEFPADATQDATQLRERLEREVREMITHGDPAVDGGLLQPAWYDPGLGGSSLLFGAPFETVHVLCDLLPLLGKETQQRVLAYLDGVVAAAPPLERAFLHGSEGWGRHPLGGSRREYHPLPADLSVNVWPPPEVPVEALFAAWEYAALGPDPSWLRSRRGQLLALWRRRAASPDRPGELVARIGMARCAALLEDHELAAAATREAVAIMREADFADWFERARTGMLRGPHDFALPVFHYRRDRVAVGAMFCDELGRFLADRQAEAIRRALAPWTGGDRDAHARSRLPAWFVHRGDYPYGEFLYRNDPAHAQAGWQGGENSFLTPDFAWGLFHLHAYGLGASAADLRAMVGTPSCVGDLYWLQRAATAVRASRPSRRVDLRREPDVRRLR